MRACARAMYNNDSILFTFYLFSLKLVRLQVQPQKVKSQMYGIVGCVIILSGQMTGVGGQSLAYVKKMLYLCIVFEMT